jgi:hypothetical protein
MAVGVAFDEMGDVVELESEKDLDGRPAAVLDVPCDVLWILLAHESFVDKQK